jgi:tRNA-dihydrouridine synthase
VQAVKNIPVIGNGDVITPQAAKKMLDDTGCTGVSIGRGAFYNPWIFQHTMDYLKSSCSSGRQSAPTSNGLVGNNEPTHVGCYEKNEGGLLPEPTFAGRVRVMCRHLDLMIEVFGEEHGCRMFRKVAPWYAKRFGPCHEFNKRVVQVSTRAGFHEVLENYTRWRQQFLDSDGELQPRFRPPPLVASFMREEPASTQREQIPVPKGPVEVW